MKIVVLAGGISPERDVSMSSGSLSANALMERGHQVALVDLFEDLPVQDLEKRFVCHGKYDYQIPEKEPELKAMEEAAIARGSWIGKGVIELCRLSDVVFLSLHGAMGENGQLQALMDLYCIPYTGSSYEGCLLAMNKHFSKTAVRTAALPTPDWVLLERQDTIPSQLPYVVKPLDGGSSLGVTIAENREQLIKGVMEARAYSNQVLLEEKIEGREFSVAVLGEQALPAIEIIPQTGFYDYQNKYQDGRTMELCPAPLEEKTAREMGEMALQIHRLLKLGYYSRIDFMMNPEGKIFFLEANTLPGMTPNSLLPQEAKAVGIDYGELCERIANHPVVRWR